MSYDDEEVREILRRALEEDEGLGHAELAAAAEEVGIEANRFERAAAAVRGERSRESAIERRRSRRKLRLARTGATYAMVNLFLFAVNFFAGGGWWFHWPLISMALLYGLQLVSHAFADDEGAVAAEEAKRAKRLRKQNRQERRQEQARARQGRQRARKQRLASAEEQFEAAVQNGVARLLESLATGLGGSRGEVEGEGEGEFATFVARREGRARAPRKRVRPSGAREGDGPSVRVSVEERVRQEEEAEVREAMAELERDLRR